MTKLNKSNALCLLRFEVYLPHITNGSKSTMMTWQHLVAGRGHEVQVSQPPSYEISLIDFN